MMKKVLSIGIIIISTYLGCYGESPSQIQLQADQLREEGKTVEALNLYNQALISYQKNLNYGGVLDVLIGRLISWQHLFNQEEDSVYAILAQKEVEAMLAIAKIYGITEKDHLIHFLLGKSHTFLKDFAAAQAEFTQAIDLYPYDNAEKGNWMAHLGKAVYQNGDKKRGISMILQGIEQIKKHIKDTDSFHLNVWLSGAYLRLAKLFFIDKNFIEAYGYLKKSEEIILNDPRLVIRQQQLHLLKQTFK